MQELADEGIIKLRDKRESINQDVQTVFGIEMEVSVLSAAARKI